MNDKTTQWTHLSFTQPATYRHTHTRAHNTTQNNREVGSGRRSQFKVNAAPSSDLYRDTGSFLPLTHFDVRCSLLKQPQQRFLTLPQLGELKTKSRPSTEEQAFNFTCSLFDSLLFHQNQRDGFKQWSPAFEGHKPAKTHLLICPCGTCSLVHFYNSGFVKMSSSGLQQVPAAVRSVPSFRSG